MLFEFGKRRFETGMLYFLKNKIHEILVRTNNLLVLANQPTKIFSDLL